MKLRNFSAHGQATTSGSQLSWELDPELLIDFPEKMGDGINHYWGILTWPKSNSENLETSEGLCRKIANASVIAIHGAHPILRSWEKFKNRTAGDDFYNLKYKIPPD